MKPEILKFARDPGKVILKGLKKSLIEEIQDTRSIFRDKEYSRTLWEGKRAS